jgi:hypothetical protein
MALHDDQHDWWRWRHDVGRIDPLLLVHALHQVHQVGVLGVVAIRGLLGQHDARGNHQTAAPRHGGQAGVGYAELAC